MHFLLSGTDGAGMSTNIRYCVQLELDIVRHTLLKLLLLLPRLYLAVIQLLYMLSIVRMTKLFALQV